MTYNLNAIWEIPTKEEALETYASNVREFNRANANMHAALNTRIEGITYRGWMSIVQDLQAAVYDSFHIARNAGATDEELNSVG